MSLVSVNMEETQECLNMETEKEEENEETNDLIKRLENEVVVSSLILYWYHYNALVNWQYLFRKAPASLVRMISPLVSPRHIKQALQSITWILQVSREMESELSNA